jgi:prefoldin alpha subunit
MENNDQQRLQELMMAVRSYQAALQEGSKKLNLIGSSLAEINETVSAVEELQKNEAGDALVPVGAGVFVKANLKEVNTLIVSSGAGIHIEKTSAETVDYLKIQAEKLEKNRNSLESQVARIEDELSRANQEAEELYMKMQGK